MFIGCWLNHFWITNHNFDTIHHVTFVSLWLYLRVLENEIEKPDDTENQN